MIKEIIRMFDLDSEYYPFNPKILGELKEGDEILVKTIFDDKWTKTTVFKVRKYWFWFTIRNQRVWIQTDRMNYVWVIKRQIEENLQVL